MFGPLEQFEIISILSFTKDFFDVGSSSLDSFLSGNFRFTHFFTRWLSLLGLSGYDVISSNFWFREKMPVFRYVLWFSINNFSFFFFLLGVFFFFFFYQSFLFNFILHTRILTGGLFFFYLIQQIINDLLINFRGKFYYFLLLFVLFILIAFLNLGGLIPYGFAITSYFSVTFLFAFIFFISIFCVGFFYHGLKLFSLFLPTGTPVVIMPLLILIECISYFARVFSLSIRLFANITAGHILLKILSWFVFLLMQLFFIGFAGFLLITILWCLEFFIACLQAYVFLILLCIYLNEVLDLNH